MSKIYTSADQLIGKTPLLELTHIEKEYGLKAKVLAKLEYFNPAGSVKDRVAKKMLDDAKNRPLISQVLESSQGGDIPVTITADHKPPSDENIAAVAAMMGGGEEVNLEELA